MTANPDPLACVLLFVAFIFLLAILAAASDYFAKRQQDRARRGLESEYGLFDRERLP